MTLIEEFEQVAQKFKGFELLKPCIELGKIWRTNREYKSLNGTLLIAGSDGIVEIDSNGNVLLFDQFRAIGSGGIFAETAAEVLFNHTEYDCRQIAEESMKIASKKCVYTNDNFIKHKLIW